MSKIIANTARFIHIMSDNNTIRYLATRHQMAENYGSRVRYTGSYWTVDTYILQGSEWKKIRYTDVAYRRETKQDVLHDIAGFVPFRMAAREVGAK